MEPTLLAAMMLEAFPHFPQSIDVLIALSNHPFGQKRLTPWDQSCDLSYWHFNALDKMR